MISTFRPISQPRFVAPSVAVGSRSPSPNNSPTMSQSSSLMSSAFLSNPDPGTPLIWLSSPLDSTRAQSCITTPTIAATPKRRFDPVLISDSNYLMTETQKRKKAHVRTEDKLGFSPLKNGNVASYQFYTVLRPLSAWAPLPCAGLDTTAGLVSASPKVDVSTLTWLLPLNATHPTATSLTSQNDIVRRLKPAIPVSVFTKPLIISVANLVSQFLECGDSIRMKNTICTRWRQTYCPLRVGCWQEMGIYHLDITAARLRALMEISIDGRERVLRACSRLCCMKLVFPETFDATELQRARVFNTDLALFFDEWVRQRPLVPERLYAIVPSQQAAEIESQYTEIIMTGLNHCLRPERLVEWMCNRIVEPQLDPASVTCILPLAIQVLLHFPSLQSWRVLYEWHPEAWRLVADGLRHIELVDPEWGVHMKDGCKHLKHATVPFNVRARVDDCVQVMKLFASVHRLELYLDAKSVPNPALLQPPNAISISNSAPASPSTPRHTTHNNHHNSHVNQSTATASPTPPVVGLDDSVTAFGNPNKALVLRNCKDAGEHLKAYLSSAKAVTHLVLPFHPCLIFTREDFQTLMPRFDTVTHLSFRGRAHAYYNDFYLVAILRAFPNLQRVAIRDWHTDQRHLDTRRSTMEELFKKCGSLTSMVWGYAHLNRTPIGSQFDYVIKSLN